MTQKSEKKWWGRVTYGIAAALMVGSFFAPPLGVISPSALFGAGMLVAAYQLIFGGEIKELSVDKTGVHVTMKDNK